MPEWVSGKYWIVPGIPNHSPKLVSVRRVKVQAKGLFQNDRNKNLQVSKFHRCNFWPWKPFFLKTTEA